MPGRRNTMEDTFGGTLMKFDSREGGPLGRDSISQVRKDKDG